MSEIVDSPEGTLCDNEGDLLVYDENESDGCLFIFDSKPGYAVDFIFRRDGGIKLGAVVRGREERVERWMAIGKLRFGSKWNSNLFTWPDGYERE